MYIKLLNIRRKICRPVLLHLKIIRLKMTETSLPTQYLVDKRVEYNGAYFIGIFFSLLLNFKIRKNPIMIFYFK